MIYFCSLELFSSLQLSFANYSHRWRQLSYPPGMFLSIHDINDKINNFTYPHCAYKSKVKHQFKNKFIQKL